MSKLENIENRLIWKEVPGFNGRYNVSIYGEIHDLKRDKFIKPHMSGVKRRNYPQVTLYRKENNKTSKHTKRVHSIMAMTFLNHTYNGDRTKVVDHIDNDPMNNNLSNLQIVSMKVNNTKDRK